MTTWRQNIREGVVVEVVGERHACRVAFEDKGGLVSAELPVLAGFAFGNKSYALPDVGDTVVCLLATNDATGGTGWIIGSRYTDKTAPAVDTADKTRIDFLDGTIMEYDRATHEFKLECVGDIYIKGRNIYLNE